MARRPAPAVVGRLLVGVQGALVALVALTGGDDDGPTPSPVHALGWLTIAAARPWCSWLAADTARRPVTGADRSPGGTWTHRERPVDTRSTSTPA